MFISGRIQYGHPSSPSIRQLQRIRSMEYSGWIKQRVRGILLYRVGIYIVYSRYVINDMARQVPTAHFFSYPLHPPPGSPLVSERKKKKSTGQRISHPAHPAPLPINRSIPGFVQVSYPCRTVQLLDTRLVVSRNVQDNISDQWWGFLEFPEVDRWRWSPDWRTAKKWSAREKPKNEHLGRSHIPAMSSVGLDECTHVGYYMYTKYGVVYILWSTEYVILYTYTVYSKYSRPVTECRTPPSPSVSFWHHQPRWNPPSPLWMGGFMRRSLPYAARDSTGEGANNNQNHLGQFGFVAGNPCSGPFLYMVGTPCSV